MNTNSLIRSILFILSFLFSFKQVYAQKPIVSFETIEHSVIEPNQASIKVEVKFTLKNTANANPFYVHIEVDKNATTAESNYDYLLLQDSILIAKGQTSGSFWVHVKGDSKDEANELITFKFKTALSSNRTADYLIGDKPNFDLMIEEVPEYEYIRLTTGIDFDFESDEESSPVAFYGNLNGFLPDQFGKKDRLGIMFNIFSNRFIGIDSLRNSETLYLKTDDLPGDSVAYKRVSLSSTEKLRTRNYGLNVGGLFKIAEKGNSSIFFALQFEGSITKNTGTYSYDTLGVINDTVSASYFDGLEVSNRLLAASRATVFTPSLTVSFPYRYLSDQIEARVFLGATVARSFDWLNLKYKWRLSPNLDINVVDKKFGVTIGGNLRYDYLTNSPVINIYIAKSFRFSQFAKF